MPTEPRYICLGMEPWWGICSHSRSVCKGKSLLQHRCACAATVVVITRVKDCGFQPHMHISWACKPCSQWLMLLCLAAWLQQPAELCVFIPTASIAAVLLGAVLRNWHSGNLQYATYCNKLLHGTGMLRGSVSCRWQCRQVSGAASLL